MSLRIRVVMALAAMVAPLSARAQFACNAPAKDPIVQFDIEGSPFEPVISADGCWLFVTLASANGDGEIAVIHRDAGQLSLFRTVSVKGNPTGAVLSHDEGTLVVASGAYVAFLDVDRLVRNDPNPVMGYVGTGAEVGFIYASVTADDKTVFVAAERGNSILVLSLEKARAGAQQLEKSAIGKLEVGGAPIAVTLSPDGRYLYTTSEVAAPEWKWHEDCRPEGSNNVSGRGRGGRAIRYHALGAIMVFDVGRAVTDPKSALLSRVAAGCNPVRLVLSPDGATAYVSARGQDQLLAYDAHRLVSDTAHAFLGSTLVGISPIGIAVIDGGARIVVTSSDRFGGTNRNQMLNVVDAAKMRAGGKNAKLGEIPAGAFPRELRVSRDDKTLFLTNFTSATVEMIDLSRAEPKPR